MTYNARREIIEFLKSDLYKRDDTLEPDPETGMTWRSPLNWRVRISGTRAEPVCEVTRPSGEHYWGPEPCNATLLDEVLP